MNKNILPPAEDAARKRELAVAIIRLNENRRTANATARQLAALQAGADRSALEAEQRRLDVERAALVTAYAALPAKPRADELIARMLAKAVLDHAEDRGAHATDEPSAGETLTAKQAAALLGVTKPDGTPRDSFYDYLAPRLGYRNGTRWLFPRVRLDAFLRGVAP